MAKPVDLARHPDYQPSERFGWVKIHYAIVPDESANYGILFDELPGGKAGKPVQR